MFSLEQALTTPGDGLMNEDTLGWTSDSAWVIDGATPLGEPYTVGHLSSATWFAAQISDSFRSFATQPKPFVPPLEVMARTQAEAARRLTAAGLAGTAYPPSASAAYLAADGDVIEVGVVGDVEVLILRKDGKVDTLSTNLPAIMVESDAGLVQWGAIEDLHKQRRAILNDRGFSNVLTRAPLRRSAVATYKIDIRDVSRVLILSDGFTRLRGLGKQNVLTEMTRGDITLAEAAVVLRQAEHRTMVEPPQKRSDDATAIVLSY